MIRPVQPNDVEALCGIYNHYVLSAISTFEDEVIPPEEMLRRIEEVTPTLPWLVWDEGGVARGFAYAGKYKARAGWRHTVECSVYLHPDARGKGIGARLYEALIADLQTRPVHVLIGGVALPNPASVALHEKFGFGKVAHFKRVGRKCGQWIDVIYLQLDLGKPREE